MNIVICKNKKAAADYIASFMAAELRHNPRKVFGLAAGATMKPIYQSFVRMCKRSHINTSKLITFNIDEYLGLPLKSPMSFGAQINKQLVRPLGLSPNNVNIPDVHQKNKNALCQSYENALRKTGGIDLQLLGIGRNGHIGFNEPCSSFTSRARIVTLTATTRDDAKHLFGSKQAVPRQGFTLGLGTILEAKKIILAAFGRAKAKIIASALCNLKSSNIPASILQKHLQVTVVVDQGAASSLTHSLKKHSITIKYLKR